MRRRLTLFFSFLVALTFLLAPARAILAEEPYVYNYTEQPPLPNPPTRGQFQGPPSTKDTTAYPGGILIVKDLELPWVKKVPPQFILEIHCNNNSFERTFRLEITTGESIQGPISGEQTASIIQAIQELRQGGQAKVTYLMHGRQGWKREWTLTGFNFVDTRYKILAVRETAPAKNELIGYIDINRPVAVEASMTEKPHVEGATPGYTLPEDQKLFPIDYWYIQDPDAPVLEFPPKFNLGFGDEFWKAFGKVFDFLKPPKEGNPIFNFGDVMVYQGKELFGSSFLGLGETTSFMLPPGDFEVKAPMKVLGIPFQMPVGGVSSTTPVQLKVSLQGADAVWYGLETLGFLLGIGLITTGTRFAVKKIKGPKNKPPTIRPAEPPANNKPTAGQGGALLGGGM